MGLATAFDTDFAIRGQLVAGLKARLALANRQEEVVEAVRCMARAIFSADGVAFVLNDDGYCHYVEEDAIAPLWKGQRFPMSACISGWAMINGKTAAIEDVYADARIPHEVYRQTFVASLIMVPVSKSAPVAAIGAYWRDQRSFSPELVALTEEVAAVVAEAMHVSLAA